MHDMFGLTYCLLEHKYPSDTFQFINPPLHTIPTYNIIKCRFQPSVGLLNI